MDIYVKSSTEAVELCWELAATGRADLFRGQTRHWPKLLPSLFRLSGNDRVAANAHLAGFMEWAERAPQMAPYKGHHIALTAIGQHYGIPTRFLDVTTDPTVAALFAKTQGPVGAADSAVIYGFLEHDLARVNQLEVVRIGVANLWRLEAQRGLFLSVGAERAMPRVLANAIRIHFPLESLSDTERTLLYPIRKSALESVIDQWIYRHQVSDIMALLDSIPNRVGIRRVTYPGAFAWRQVPAFNSNWAGHEPRWIYPAVEPFELTTAVCNLSVSGINTALSPSAVLSQVRQLVEPAVRQYRQNLTLLSFQISLINPDAEMDRRVSTLANRCWDGLRVLPYPTEELTEAIALTIALLCHCGGGGGGGGGGDIDFWVGQLWGESQLIDVAPVGGHLDAALVNRRDLESALSSHVFPKLTAWMRRRCVEDPRAIMDYIVDPWLLFDFVAFRRLFATQFVPTAVAIYLNADLREGEGNLSSLWSVPFNAALLGFVTLAEYRFRSPIAGEADVERIILLAPDMEPGDVEEIFTACLPSVLAGGEPFQVRFTDCNRDEREVWEIDRVVEQCNWIVELGGISVLDVCPSVRNFDAPEPSPLWPRQGLGALDIWLIAQRRLSEFNGRPFDEYRPVIDQFLRELKQANENLESRGRAQPNWPGD